MIGNLFRYFLLVMFMVTAVWRCNNCYRSNIPGIGSALQQCDRHDFAPDHSDCCGGDSARRGILRMLRSQDGKPLHGHYRMLICLLKYIFFY